MTRPGRYISYTDGRFLETELTSPNPTVPLTLSMFPHNYSQSSTHHTHHTPRSLPPHPTETFLTVFPTSLPTAPALGRIYTPVKHNPLVTRLIRPTSKYLKGTPLIFLCSGHNIVIPLRPDPELKINPKRVTHHPSLGNFKNSTFQ